MNDIIIVLKNGEACVSSKKGWMKKQFKEGLIFKRLDARGKVFIEYILAEIARSKGQSITFIKIDSKEQAQNTPAPFTKYSFFHNGKFITNEIFSESKFAKYLEEIGV